MLQVTLARIISSAILDGGEDYPHRSFCIWTDCDWSYEAVMN